MKIYLENEEEIERYKKLGVPIHEGPRGGKYVLSEDLKHTSLYRNENGGGAAEPKEVISRDLKGFKGMLDDFAGSEVIVNKTEDGVMFGFEDVKGFATISFEPNAVRISLMDNEQMVDVDEFAFEYENEEEFAAGLHTLMAAIDIAKDEQKFQKMYKDVLQKSRFLGKDISPPKSKYGKLKMAITLVSLDIGRKNFNKLKRAEKGETVKKNIQYVLGPWLSNYVRVDDDADVKAHRINTKLFYKDLQEMFLVASAVGKMPTIKLTSVQKIKAFRSKETFAFYHAAFNSIYLPMDKDFGNNYGYGKAMWHEYQHYLYKQLNWDSNSFGPMMAFQLAQMGMLTNYAKTNDNEALSELVGMYAEGVARSEDAWKQMSGVMDWVRKELKENSFKYAGG